VIIKKSYKNLMKNLGRRYAKLIKNLRLHYRYLTGLCQRLLLVEYFELKITDNKSDDFLRMLSKNDLPFS